MLIPAIPMIGVNMLNRLRAQSKWAIQRVRQSRFTRDVAFVGMGIAVAQGISLAFMPILTRMYGPEAFGVLGVFTAVVNIITPVATLSYANAIVLPDTDEEAHAVVRLSLIVSLAVASIALLLVHALQAHLAAWTGLAETPGMLYLIPLSLLLGAFYAVATQKAIRLGLFGAKSRAHVESTVFVNSSKLTGGFLHPSGLTLILIHTVTPAIGALVLLARMRTKGVVGIREWFGRSGTVEVARRYRDFPYFRMPQSIINAASLGLPVILLSALFGPSVAGQYSLAALILGAPVMLLGQSVGEVFFRKITRAVSSEAGNAHDLVSKATLALFVLGLGPFGVIMIYGDHLFPLIFGEEWHRAGEYSQWMALWLLSTLMNRPSVAAMPSLGMQAHLLAYEVFITFARVLALLAGSSFFADDLAAVALFSIVNLIGYVILITMVYVRTESFDRGLCDAR
jgi:O-antigen/teichoic acid export membrane protein